MIMSIAKSRNFAFILYPESLPEGWEGLLESLGIPMAISPLHDKDKTEPKTKDTIRKDAERKAKKQCENIIDEQARALQYENAKAYWINQITADQLTLPEFKKAHYHVLYVAHNPVTADSVLKKLRRKLGNDAVGHVEIVDNVENYHLYLTHESADAKAKNKHIYDRKDIKYLNAFDISRYITIDKEQKQDLFVALVELVDEKNIMNMKQLMAVIREHGKDIGIESVKELISITDSNAWFLKMVFDGNYQEKKMSFARQEEELERQRKGLIGLRNALEKQLNEAKKGQA